ncbi:MAG: hypothetical protein QJR09_05125 [Micrococcus sp.]|nr:hypothetical protein [Micrococcus sp.]
MSTDPRATLAEMKFRAAVAATFGRYAGKPTLRGYDRFLLHQSLRTDAPHAYAALEAVLDLHQPHRKAGADGTRDFTICRECQHMEDGRPSDVYPCPTIRAITEHLGDDQ